MLCVRPLQVLGKTLWESLPVVQACWDNWDNRLVMCCMLIHRPHATAAAFSSWWCAAMQMGALFMFVHRWRQCSTRFCLLYSERLCVVSLCLPNEAVIGCPHGRGHLCNHFHMAYVALICQISGYVVQFSGRRQRVWQSWFQVKDRGICRCLLPHHVGLCTPDQDICIPNYQSRASGPPRTAYAYNIL
jgi:hypothetical protein